MSEGGNEARLEKIQGGIDVLRTLLEAAGRINDERHARMSSDVDDIRGRVHRHGNELMVVQAEIKSLSDLDPRISTLEDERHQRDGEKRGISNTIKTAWMLGGGGVTAVLLAVLRKLGLM